MTNPLVKAVSNGAIIFDRDYLDDFPSEYFDPDYWISQNLVTQEAVGRGTTLIVQFNDVRWVLRHYRRGGLFGRVVEDSYLWTGARRTRCFREWRLLADLMELQLPVPRPVAARFVRHGQRYTADLITECIPNVETLASLLQRKPEMGESTWERIGGCVGKFHEAGVYHADLNAHNIMLSKDGSDVHIIDFDRGYFRPGDQWKQKNLDRLKRSLRKVAGFSDQRFGGRQWGWLLGGYGAVSSS